MNACDFIPFLQDAGECHCVLFGGYCESSEQVISMSVYVLNDDGLIVFFLHKSVWVDAFYTHRLKMPMQNTVPVVYWVRIAASHGIMLRLNLFDNQEGQVV